MHKAELHLHLEGSIEPDTLLRIGPDLTREEIEAHMPRERTFDAFIESYVWVSRRLNSPEHYALAARDLLARLASQDVTYAEITLSAGVVLWKKQDLAAIYDAVWAETQRASIPAFWILDAVRQFGPEPAMEVAEFAVSRREQGAIAFGIGGFEARGPAEWFGEVFRYARNGGLRLVAHAGETVGPESVWAALEIGAERIGHGIAAIGDPELTAHLRDNRIPLEINISSNLCTGVTASLRDHPVRRLYDAGVPIVINTDDPALFRTSLDREYMLATGEFGLDGGELARNSFEFAFRWNGARAPGPRLE